MSETTCSNVSVPCGTLNSPAGMLSGGISASSDEVRCLLRTPAQTCTHSDFAYHCSRLTNTAVYCVRMHAHRIFLSIVYCLAIVQHADTAFVWCLATAGRLTGGRLTRVCHAAARTMIGE